MVGRSGLWLYAKPAEDNVRLRLAYLCEGSAPHADRLPDRPSLVTVTTLPGIMMIMMSFHSILFYSIDPGATSIV
jgi:hypothetical protein